MARRSVLFSPGDQADLLRKAPETEADVVVYDLEDAVRPAQKDHARDIVADVLADIDPPCELCVRVNPVGLGAEDDVAEVIVDAAETVDAVVLPKVADADDVTAFEGILSGYDLSMPIFAILETAKGILDAEAVAQTDAVDALVFGAEDLAADIGATRTPDGTEISHARQHVVLAASAGGVDAIDTLVTDYGDTEHLKEDAARSVQLGFDGKLAIHPAQVPVINDAFSPDEEDIEWARRVLEADAAADDAGVFTVDGKMIDGPLIEQARTILERADE